MHAYVQVSGDRKERICEVLYCCLPTFAMMGALAWQVMIPNKVSDFVFGGEMVRGFCPALLSVSCLWFLSLFPRIICKIYSDIKFGGYDPRKMTLLICKV
ncbi:hypothetical protein HAX54_037195 [Datura stramonium]|uniref:Uncharacterized protein n=1 Tax=Datura stramonium TaxID=4076 RepID=A0ABS8VIT9_DATST|nr:hypothetical protein [Datura stramonium]